MGCGKRVSTDIRICVEVREGGDRWRAVVNPNPWHGSADDEPEERLTGWLWDGPDHDLFAILADVRNRVGFAGTDRDEAIAPIALPAGLPEDVKRVSNDEMPAIVAGEMPRAEGKRYFTRLQWTRTLRELAGYFLDDVIPVLEQLGGPDDVRLVFWCDN